MRQTHTPAKNSATTATATFSIILVSEKPVTPVMKR